MTNTTAVPDLPFTIADAFSIFQDLTEAMDAVSKGHQDSEEIARLMLKKTDAIHPRFFAATQPAPSGDAVAMWRVCISGKFQAFSTFAEAERERREYEVETGEPHEDPEPMILATTSRAATVAKDGGEVIIFGKRGDKMTFTVGVQTFTLDYEPEDDLCFTFMCNMLSKAIRRVTLKPEASAANQQAIAWAFPDGLERLARVREGYSDSPLLTVNAVETPEFSVPIYAAPISEDANDIRVSGNTGDGVLVIPAAPAACNGDALPEVEDAVNEILKPHVAGYLRPSLNYRIARLFHDRAARAGTGSAGSEDK